jgi:hypothetical protein
LFYSVPDHAARGISPLPHDPQLISFHPEMALFPMSGVLRGFSACDVPDVRLGGNPCVRRRRTKLKTYSCHPLL